MDTIRQLVRRQRGIDRDAENTDTQDTTYLPATMAFTNFLAMPGLRGFWPFSSVNESANIIDMSGQGRTLTGSGTRTFGVMTNGGCYATFNGSDTYYYRADEAGLDITTSMTMLGWFYTGITTSHVLASKANTSQISYQLDASSATASRFRALVSSNGSATTAAEATADYTINTWYFVALRYTASTELALFWYAANDSTDGEKVSNTTSIPAAIHSGSAEFDIGRNQVGGNYLNGRAAYVALITYPLSDALIMALYESSRNLFTA